MTDDVPPRGPRDAPPSDGVPSAAGSTPGAALAASREQAGLSVEDVAAATRIRSTLVRAIEQDEYERCGGEVYARGHIRSIAHVVGADAESLVADFDRRYGRQPPKLTVAPISTIGEPVREVTRKANRSAPKWPAAAIAVLALVVVLLAVSWVAGRGDRNAGPRAGGVVATPSTVPSPTETTAPSSEPPTSTPPPSPTLPPGVTVHVAITSSESWLRVISSKGVQLYEGTLAKGQVKDFHDPTTLSLRFGNAPVVELTVNGTKTGKPCPSQVCDVTFPADRTQAG